MGTRNNEISEDIYLPQGMLASVKVPQLSSSAATSTAT
jgi:hypothetical protein